MTSQDIWWTHLNCWWNYNIGFWQQCCWKVKSSRMWHCHWVSGCWRYHGWQCLQNTAAYYQSTHGNILEDLSHTICNLYIILTTFHILIPTPHHLSHHAACKILRFSWKRIIKSMVFWNVTLLCSLVDVTLLCSSVDVILLCSSEDKYQRYEELAGSHFRTENHNLKMYRNCVHVVIQIYHRLITSSPVLQFKIQW